MYLTICTHIEHLKNVIDTLGSPSDAVLQNITSPEVSYQLSLAFVTSSILLIMNE